MSSVLPVCWYITNAGLEHLPACTALQQLHLSHCHRIGDEGVAHIGRLARLTSLSPECCYNVGDDGLTYLHVLTELVELDLRYCRAVSAAGLARLRSSMPHLERVHNLQSRAPVDLHTRWCASRQGGAERASAAAH